MGAISFVRVSLVVVVVVVVVVDAAAAAARAHLQVALRPPSVLHLEQETNFAQLWAAFGRRVGGAKWFCCNFACGCAANAAIQIQLTSRRSPQQPEPTGSPSLLCAPGVRFLAIGLAGRLARPLTAAPGLAGRGAHSKSASDRDNSTEILPRSPG